MVLVASERDIFDESGPLHLIDTDIDWNNEHHKRSVIASLVQATYVLELDRQNKREGVEALAPPWYESFHYQPINHLIDDVDSSIFGAIFKYTFPESDPQTPLPPHYVIAFRGTLTSADSRSRDLSLDLEIVKNTLHKTSRYQIAIKAISDTISQSTSDVWLAGHSLGSAMAILAGRTMAKNGTFLTTFLFNPPFLSAPLERIKTRRLKHGLRVAGSLLTAGLAYAMSASNSEARFVALSDWIPSLFVNPKDHICSEYIGYFEHRNVMEEIGVGRIEKLATQNSVGGLLLSAMGSEDLNLEPIHLIPSANLTVNFSRARSFREAHGIHQWFKEDQSLESMLYKYV